MAAPAVGPQRLSPVPARPVGLHDQDVAGVAVRVEAEQLLGRVDGQRDVAQPDRRPHHHVEGPHPLTPLPAAGGVEPFTLGAGDEGAAGELAHLDCGRQGLVDGARGPRRLGLVDGGGGRLHVDHDVVGQAQPVAAVAADQHVGVAQPGRAQERPHPAHHHPQAGLPRRGQGLGPEDLGQGEAVDGPGPLEDEHGEGEPGPGATETGLVDQGVAGVDRHPAAERDPHLPEAPSSARSRLFGRAP